MSAARIVLRNMWKSDHPAVFGQTPKGLKKYTVPVYRKPRVSFDLWLLKTFRPKLYKRLEKLALEPKPTTEENSND